MRDPHSQFTWNTRSQVPFSPRFSLGLARSPAPLFFFRSFPCFFCYFFLHRWTDTQKHSRRHALAHTHTREFVLVIDLEMICGKLGTPTRLLRWPIELNLPRSFPPPLHIETKKLKRNVAKSFCFFWNASFFNCAARTGNRRTQRPCDTKHMTTRNRDGRGLMSGNVQMWPCRPRVLLRSSSHPRHNLKSRERSEKAG